MSDNEPTFDSLIDEEQLYKEYYVIGKGSFHIKEDLKSMGCRWSPAMKKWRTPNLQKGEFLFKEIESLAKTYNCKIVPCEEYLSKEANIIQNILNGDAERIGKGK